MKEVAAAEPTEPAAELDVELDIALSMFLIEEAASMSMMSIDYGKKNCGKSPKCGDGKTLLYRPRSNPNPTLTCLLTCPCAFFFANLSS